MNEKKTYKKLIGKYFIFNKSNYRIDEANTTVKKESQTMNELLYNVLVCGE